MKCLLLLGFVLGLAACQSTNRPTDTGSMTVPPPPPGSTTTVPGSQVPPRPAAWRSNSLARRWSAGRRPRPIPGRCPFRRRAAASRARHTRGPRLRSREVPETEGNLPLHALRRDTCGALLPVVAPPVLGASASPPYTHVKDTVSASREVRKDPIRARAGRVAWSRSREGCRAGCRSPSSSIGAPGTRAAGNSSMASLMRWPRPRARTGRFRTSSGALLRNHLREHAPSCTAVTDSGVVPRVLADINVRIPISP